MCTCAHARPSLAFFTYFFLFIYFIRKREYLANLRDQDTQQSCFSNDLWPESLLQNAPRAVAFDFQQCGILTYVDSDEPLKPPFKLKNSKWCSVSSFTVIEYSRD